MNKQLPLVLLILDGWGYREEKQFNAIAMANTPQWDQWWQSCSHTLLDASGKAVGLPSLQMGNSEVGHMHIGAGRVLPQDFTRINQAIDNGDFLNNSVFLDTLEDLKATKKSLHIMGLLSAGGVHSHEKHLLAFLDLCVAQNFSNVYLHLFLDGRDTPPQSALESLEHLETYLKTHPIAKISSITGRYYAMDRDKRWQRIEPVYNLLTEALSEEHFSNAPEAIQFFYQKNIFDEFIPPTSIGEFKTIQDGDAVFFFNFRQDRARQLTEVFINNNFSGFQRKKTPKLSKFVSMTTYGQELPTTSAFSPMVINNTLGEVLEKHGLRQLRIAETEKYAHVTFFFNGGMEKTFKHEHRTLIPSPQVSTYDLQPEMSTKALTQALVKAINSDDYDVIICNYANADMVGHTGNLQATIQAIECLDKAMRKIGEALNNKGGQLIITADHGNAESMFDEHAHQALTSHTTEPVPFLYVGGKWKCTTSMGSLVDVAPTILRLLNIAPPKEMTGTSLLEPSA